MDTNYPPREEFLHSLTHGLGAALSVVGLIVLLARGGADEQLSLLIFGLSLVLLFGASACYHAARHPKRRRSLRIADHAAIYLLIAGTYTPFVLLGLEATWRWGLFATIWGLACTGVVFKCVALGRFPILSTVFYLIMGWLGAGALGDLVHTLPQASFIWLIVGGVIYSAGVVFYVWDRLPYNHVIWHGFVLGGSGCHYAAVLALVSV